MSQTESLTIEILGDSSGLQQELSSVADMLDQLEEQLAAATEEASGFGEAFSGLEGALGPLQALGGELSLISQQIQQLASQPVTLNVEPALNALNQLMQSAQAAAMQLAALSAFSLPGLPMMAGFPMEGIGGFPQAFAEGGLVTGPEGVDKVSARLTAGEFVLNADAVASLGIGQLERWNRGQDLSTRPVPELSELSFSSRLSTESPRPDRNGSISSGGESVVKQTMNHFGGIEIHVRQTADVGRIMQDLRQQGIQTRHRWG